MIGGVENSEEGTRYTLDLVVILVPNRGLKEEPKIFRKIMHRRM